MLLQMLPPPVHVLLGFDVCRQTNPFSLVTLPTHCLGPCWVFQWTLMWKTWRLALGADRKEKPQSKTGPQSRSGQEAHSVWDEGKAAEERHLGHSGGLTRAGKLQAGTALDVLQVREAVRAGPAQRDVHSRTETRKDKVTSNEPQGFYKWGIWGTL